MSHAAWEAEARRSLQPRSLRPNINSTASFCLEIDDRAIMKIPKKMFIYFTMGFTISSNDGSGGIDSLELSKRQVSGHDCGVFP